MVKKEYKTVFLFLCFTFILNPAFCGQGLELSREGKISEALLALEDSAKPAPSPSEAKNNKSSAVDLHGYYLNRHYIDKKKDSSREHNYELRQDLRLEVSQNISENLQYLASMDARFDVVRNTLDKFEKDEEKIQLWELYLNGTFEKFNLRIGKQAIRWGKSDEVNPTDAFTPEDLDEYLNFTRAERKIPVWMLKANYSLEPYQLELIWLPYFVPSRIPEAGSDWEAYLLKKYRSIGFDVKEPKRPPRNLKSQVTALKLIKNTTDYDFSLSYAYHFDELPTLFLNVPTLEVRQLYPRQHTFGSDFETVIGKVGLRQELAYTLKDLFVSYAASRPDTAISKDTLTGIIGVDYTFKNKVYLNLQYLAQYIPKHEKDMVPMAYEDSLIWKISRKFRHDTLLLEGSGRVYLFDLDYYYQIKCEYDINDFLRATIGYDGFFGPDDGTFGQYNSNDQIFAKLRYSF